MGYRQAVTLLCCLMFLVPACTELQSDCSLNPNLECFATKPVGGGGTGGAAGGGGTGGMPECSKPSDCGGQAPTCKEHTCIGGTCGLANVADGTTCGANNALACEGGECKGCESAGDCGIPIFCHEFECNNQTCTEKPNGMLSCGLDGTGSCSDTGECGLCTDNTQNGDETGIDCGTGTSCGLCPGNPCAQNTECHSGFCADGVCCDTACDATCEACINTATGVPSGTCAPVTLGTEADPANPECAGKGGCGAIAGWCACEDGEKNGNETDIDCGGACIGAGDEGKCTKGQGCGSTDDCGGDPSFCVDGVCCNTECTDACKSCNQPGLLGLCSPLTGDDAAGSCTADTNQQCHPELECEATNTNNCGTNDDCASGLCKGSPKKCAACDNGANMCPSSKTCLNGLCVTKDRDNGESCVDGSMCASAFCVDGVCCDKACGGLCMACQGNYTGQNDGTCAPLLAGYDPHDKCTGPGNAATCSGQLDAMDTTKSTCGTN